MNVRRWSEGVVLPSNPKQGKSLVRLQDEKKEVIGWINHHLSIGGYSDSLINDLIQDMTDGITLIKLLHSITGDSLRHHYSTPLTRLQKLENVQICLRYLKQKGMSIAGINPEDIVRGNLKVILALCHSLRHQLEGSSPKFNSHDINDAGKRTRPWKSNDAELLMWVEEIVHRRISDYSSLRDGHILCGLVNAVHKGAIQFNEQTMSSPINCLKLAFSSAENYMGITLGLVDVMQIVNGEDDHTIKLFVEQLKSIYEEKEVLRRSKDSLDGTTSLPSTTDIMLDNEGSRLLPYEAKQHYTSLNHLQQGSINEHKHMCTISGSQQHVSGVVESRNNSRMRVSYSTDHINTFQSGSHVTQTSGDLKPHVDISLKTSRQLNRAQQRPMSFDNMGSNYNTVHEFRGNRHDMNTSRNVQYPQGPYMPQNLSSNRQIDRGIERPSSGNVSRYPFPNSTTTVELSYSNDIPLPVTIYRTSSRSSIHSTSSRSSMERNSTDDHLNLTHLTNIPPFIPPHMLPMDTRIGTEKQRDGRMTGNGFPPGSVSYDQLTRCVDDLSERVKELAILMAEEREDVIHKLLHAVSKEREKRVSLERKHESLVRKSRHTTQLYEASLVQLAKEVSTLKGDLQNIHQQLSTIDSLHDHISYITTELKMIKQTVATSQHHLQSKQQPSSLETNEVDHSGQMKNPTSATEKGKKNIFSRKKSEKT